MTERSPIDAFKDVLSGAARSIARDMDVEGGFTADAPHAVGKAIKVPTPGRALPADQVALARGFADASALKLRHHDARVHASSAPGETVARAVFDAVEQARVEAIGSRSMAGVRANLNEALALRLKSDAIRRARSADEVPLSTALALKVRERLTGQAIPKDAAPGVAIAKAVTRAVRMLDAALFLTVMAMFLLGLRRPFIWVLAYLYIDILAPQKIGWTLTPMLPISFMFRSS